MIDQAIKYSIIITIYDSKKFLTQYLESVEHQSYKNWKLIMVNDSSTDTSGAIAKNYANKINQYESKSKVIYLEHNNHGAVYSRERDIYTSTGYYLYLLALMIGAMTILLKKS